MDQRGDLGVLPTPLVMQRGDAEGLIAEGMNNTLLLLPTPVFFAPGSSRVANGFFGLFVSFV